MMILLSVKQTSDKAKVICEGFKGRFSYIVYNICCFLAQLLKEREKEEGVCGADLRHPGLTERFQPAIARGEPCESSENESSKANLSS